MLCLTTPTREAWLDAALADLDAVLIDHAHCEIKAATNALSLASRVPTSMAPRLAELAEEEVRHFREVLDVLAARGLSLGMPAEDAYAKGLRAIAHRTAPSGRSPTETLVDRLLVAALVEARSCERFKLLASALAARGEAELSAFYDDLFASEARHYRVLVDLAIEALGGDEQRVRARLDALAVEEGMMVAGLSDLAAVHG